MKRPVNELPPWSPRPGAETRRLIGWTIARWDDLWGAPDAATEAAETSPHALPDAALLFTVASRDEKAFVRLMKNEKQARLAFRLFTAQEKPRAVGRPPKADDEEPYWPSQIVDDVWAIWKRHYGKWQRRDDLAFQIASKILKREGVEVDADTIKAFRRKHGKTR